MLLYEEICSEDDAFCRLWIAELLSQSMGAGVFNYRIILKLETPANGF